MWSLCDGHVSSFFYFLVSYIWKSNREMKIQWFLINLWKVSLQKTPIRNNFADVALNDWSVRVSMFYKRLIVIRVDLNRK
jgi:hypothetical protein